jgi:hypothetical protein
MQQMSLCCAALFLTVLAQFCLAAPALCAQELQQPDRVNVPKGGPARPTFLTQTKLVTVTFTFRPSARQKRLLTRNGLELASDDIEILDNGVPRRVAVLERTASSEATLPTDVVVLFDYTKRFRQYIDRRVINLHFLDELESVRLAIYGFSDHTYRLIRPSRDPVRLTAAMATLSRIPIALHTDENPILQTLQDAITTPGSRPRMMIIFSGAVERPCQLPRNEYDRAIDLAKEYDIALFPVAVEPQTPPVQSPSVPGQRGAWDPVPRLPRALNFAPVAPFLSIGPATGGKGFARYAMPKTVLEEVLKYVRSQARSELVAGFYLDGSSGSDKAPHRIEVRLKRDIGELTGGVRETNY